MILRKGQIPKAPCVCGVYRKPVVVKDEGVGRKVDAQLRSPPGYLLHMLPESACPSTDVCL